MSVTMSYGGSSIVPVPIISLTKSFQRTANGLAVAQSTNISLQGDIVLSVGEGGLPEIIEQVRYLRGVFNKDGKYFKLACDGTTLLEGYPRIESELQFNESTNNWIFSCPYTITLQFDVEPVNINIAGSGENTNLLSPYINSYEDNWNFEFDDSSSKYIMGTSAGQDKNSIIIRATHEVSAQGKSHYDGPGNTGSRPKEAWQYARDLVVTKLNVNPNSVLLSGVFNTPSNFSNYNHFRVQKINESAGEFGVSETFILLTGSAVIEEFTVDIRSGLQDLYTTVGINGSVQGLEGRTYGNTVGDFSISSTKFANASGYFESIKDTAMIYPRAQALVAVEGITLNSTPLTRVIGKSPTRGLITYNYEYDNSPSTCIVGAKTESISINDENPTDVFSRITIMGRRQGPILQYFNTITDFRRNVTIDALMSPSTGCSSVSAMTGTNPRTQVSAILCVLENDLRSRYNKVYKERDSEVWEPKGGRYSRSVSWAAVDCTFIPPISLCSGA